MAYIFLPYKNQSVKFLHLNCFILQKNFVLFMSSYHELRPYLFS